MKKKKNDLISIIITTYNSNLEYLEECMNSIVKQSYTNLEIIIVDDFSNLENFKNQKKYLIKKYNDKRIKFLRNKKNYGVGYSLNCGIKNSKGKYINWCSYDDYFHIDKIKIQHNKIKYLNNTILTCNTLIKYESLNFFRGQNYDFLEKNKDALIFKDKFSGGSFLIPRSVFRECGFFNISLRFVQDYDMWLRWYNHNIKFYNINKFLFYTRIHTKQDTNKNYFAAVKEKKYFYMNYFKKYIDYFLNFYSNKEIFLISNYFVYRDYKKVANFVKTEQINNILRKKKYFLAFFMSIFFFISFGIVKFLRILNELIKYLALFVLKFFSILRNLNKA